jgi:hypothetical protein
MKAGVNWPAMIFALLAAMGAAWALRTYTAEQERELAEVDAARQLAVTEAADAAARLERLKVDSQTKLDSACFTMFRNTGDMCRDWQPGVPPLYLRDVCAELGERFPKDSCSEALGRVAYR